MYDELEINSVLKDYGLHHHASAILAAAQPGIGFRTQPVPDILVPVGVTKLGGYPDLPSHTPWPVVNGYPLAFIAQIDLASVASYDRTQSLPDQGLLFFFFGSNRDLFTDPADSDGFDCRVFYDDGAASTVQRHPPPVDLQREHVTAATYGRVYPASAVQTTRIITLPDVDDASVRQMDFTRGERNRYIDMYMGIKRMRDDAADQVDHRLLGYPRSMETNPLVECALKAQGRTIEAWVTATRAEQEAIDADAQEWCLLLQVDSDRNTDMVWESSGVLYFCIKKSDLRRQRFDRVIYTMQFM